MPLHKWSTIAANNATADSTVSWPEGMAPSQVNDSARAEMAAVAKWRNDISGTVTTGGTATAYTMTTNSTFASASDMSGAMLCFIPHTSSGASPTLAVDGLTARALNISTGVAVPTGYFVAGTPYVVTYIHASTEFIVRGATTTALTNISITGGTALTAPAIDDELPVYDLSATANRKIQLQDMLKVVNSLTEDTAPANASDFVLTYDTSASAVKKVKPASILASAIPTIQRLTSGTAAPFTPTAGKTLWHIRMIGPGGGGGAVSGGGAGSNGSAATSFQVNSTGTAWTAAGGAGGQNGAAAEHGGAGGSGGTDGSTGTLVHRMAGNPGGPGGGSTTANTIIPGGAGGSSVFGGAGRGTSGSSAAAGTAAATNSGSGGGGAGGGSAASSGAGGGAGEYVEFWVTGMTTATYTIGTGGNGQAAGGQAGGNGGAGIVIVEEF